jgi:hypothetical protein
MSTFGKIKDAIFGRDAEAQGALGPAPTPGPAGSAYADAPGVPPAQPQHTTIVNVENSLDSMPGADRLNWRTSLVDLMELIGVESDYESRRALATEMGCENYSGSTEDNVWLHQRVMQELASNGGGTP